MSHEQFELFFERTQQLLDLRLVKKRLQTKLTIHWDAISSTLTSTLQNPDEEDLRSFLLTFRQFVSRKEPVFVPRIFNECIRFVPHDVIRQELEKAKRHWNQSLNESIGFGLTIDVQKITGEHVLDLWINGIYFHNDLEKKQELERLSGFNRILVRTKFLSILPGLVQIITFLSVVIKNGLSENWFDSKQK